MSDSFTHCHVHSHFSMLDGMAKIDPLFAEAERLGMPALAITDHGNMFGAAEFYRTSKRYDVKPILGMESYVAPEGRYHKKPVLWGNTGQRKSDEFGEGGDVSGAGAYCHMTMLAENVTGLRNLFRLSSLASFQGYYRKPRMDKELISQHATGIIATTGCASGEVQTRLRLGQRAEALQSASDYRDIFGERSFFLELMDHGLAIERSVQEGLLEIGRTLGLQPLATNDSHYVTADQTSAHDALLCQPPGTMVRRVIPQSKVGSPQGASFPTLTEDVPIETIRVGDRVVSWSGKQRRGVVHKSGSLVSQIGTREYSDEIVGVRTDSGLASRYTYDHKTIVRLDGQLRDGNFVVYLMRKGALFRVGVTQYRRNPYRREGRGCDLGPMYRLKEEVGDDIWILSVHESLDDAREEEGWVGYRYNIPTWTFTKLGNRSCGRKAFYERLWDRIGSDLGDRAKACLADFDRDVRFPLLTRGSLFIVRPQVVRACNLLSGMLACTPRGETVHTYDGTGVWRPVEVFRETYSGPVYSIEVEGDHTYIADGIVTHNCIQTSKTLSDPDRFRFDGEGYFLKSAEEMRAYWDVQVPGAADATLAIAERVGSYDEVFAEIDRKPRVPLEPGDTEDAALRREVDRGIALRFPNGLTSEYRERLDTELAIISAMNYSGYFLVVGDLVNWALARGILCRGRGSAAGSLAVYALRITDIDPIVHSLFFERFLNPDRVSPPDVDLDVDERHRGELVRYLTERWGSANVAQVITFNTIKTKAAIKDAARVLGHPFVAGEALVKALPPAIFAQDVPLSGVFDPRHERYSETAEIRELVESDPVSKEIVEAARGLEGLIRQAGVHACGVFLSSEPLLDVIPLWKRQSDEAIVTGWDWSTCESVGLQKLDVLGSKTLTTIASTLAAVQANHGVEVDLATLELDDSEVYTLLSKGDTLGVFQFDGAGARDTLQRIAPTRFEDICAAGALYRPGPMGMGAHHEYADRKNGRTSVVPIHPELEESLADILSETYSLCTYQEDVMAIARRVAGYTLGQADLLRRAMGKKKKDVLDGEYVRFRDGMASNGFSADATKALWDTLLPFADYAFPRAHAASYGLVSYWTAWLKVHYPAEFMAARLTAISDKDKAALYLAECRHMGIKVLTPDVNESDLNFTATADGVRFGLGAVRNIGESPVASIVATRNTFGRFESFADFLAKVPASVCNKRVIPSLIKAGAFDSLGHRRQALFETHSSAVDYALENKRQDTIGQVDLFGDLTPELPPEGPEWPRDVLLAHEREMLGLYVSDHPLRGVDLRKHASRDIATILAAEPAQDAPVTIAGLITAVNRKTTKKDGKRWAAVSIEDLDATMEVLVFPREYEELSGVLAVDAVVAVKGRINRRDETVSVVATDMFPLDAVPAVAPVTLTIPAISVTRDLMDRLKVVCVEHKGTAELRIELTGHVTTVLVAEGYPIDPCPEFKAKIKTILEGL